ncbi:alpha-2-macroglobulin family protein [Cerasicoccus arenae]|nr:MG2 domain-containing protein [Cerasicoccus arenae]MBK1859136.1 hypothetical protein [Cerasicoccus arenae]
MLRCPFPRVFGFIILLAALNLSAQTPASPPPPADLIQADKNYADHNYRAAAELYAKLLAQDSLPLPLNRDQLVFRLADSTWRNLAATQQSDHQILIPPREQLTQLATKLRKEAKGTRPPQLWADIQESLGDSFWLPEQFRDWGQAWNHYQQALNWWAGSTNLDLAREHYLDIVFRAARPPNVNNYWRYGDYYGNWIPENILQNAVDIAIKPDQQAHANYLLAVSLARQYGEKSIKAGESFQAALIAGNKTEWADDALFSYAQWAARFGASEWNQNGQFVAKPDFALALRLYQQFLENYQKGDSRYWNQVKNQVESITKKSINVIITNSYLPGSIVQFQLQWRNMDQVAISLYSIDLEQAFKPERTDNYATPYSQFHYDLTGKTPILRLTRESDDQAYAWQNSSIQIEEGLNAGAYVIEATGLGESAQGLLLITEQMVTVLRDSETILAWVNSAHTGQPTSEASVTVWIGNQHYEKNQHFTEWHSAQKTSAEDGIARFTAKDFSGLTKSFYDYEQLVAITQKDSQPAITTSRNYGYNFSQYEAGNQNAWKVYAYTDRPAYRPNDIIHWKATARIRDALTNWRVPNDQTIYYKVSGPQGDQVAEGTMPLNEYGSIWGEFTAGDDWKLGMYSVEFRRDSSKGSYIGNAELFRLEEYKLPEYKVAVSAASKDGDTATAYRLGDEVQVEIVADYYFGGAVTNAEIEIVVRESPYYHRWSPPSSYPWLRNDHNTRYRGYNPGSVVMNETLKTDAEGRARFALPTKASSPYDLEYTIEARVTDESRREVSGQAKIRATRAPYFVYLNPERTLYRPGETASVTVQSLNANDDPVSIEGQIRLTREEWMQVWRGPDGEEISGQEFERRIKKGPSLFSSALDPTQWTKIREGYDIEEIKTTVLHTGEDGKATFSFPVQKTGYYRVYWVSRPERTTPIRVDTAVWVADSSSQSIGFHGDLKIVADEQSFREGSTAPVMVTTPDPGRWVLFSVQGAGLIDTKVIYLEGNVKLLQYNVSDQWIPNIWLQANANYDLRPHQDRMAIVVPPDKHFLDVSVVTNAENYQPKDKATALITTRDVNGRPVAVEVALSIFDESVLYIQPTIAPDPREFFYGELRSDAVQTLTSQSQQGLTEIKPIKTAELGQDSGNRYSRKEGMENDLEIGSSLIGSTGGFTDPFSAPAAASGPMAEGALANRSSFAKSLDSSMVSADDAGAPPAEPSVVVRNDFRATVLWKPAIQTDTNGQASVEFEFPDNLTTWELEAHAVGLPASFGQGKSQAKTRLPLIARLQTPRFLVTGDTLTITGVLNNNTDGDMAVKAELVITGGISLTDSATQSIDVPAHGSTQVNWPVSVKKPGPAKMTLTTRSPTHSDAMELTIPVFEHGIDKFLALSGKMTTDNLKLKFDVPKFKPEGATLTLHLSPSIATTMLDALPYLAQYPYGCTEQTMSRFLPAVIVSKTLKDLGVPADVIKKQSFGGIEASTPKKIIQKVKPRQEGGISELNEMVAAGLTRLTDFQHSDGGWGWWKQGNSDPYMSAYVVWGLTLAQQAGRKIDDKMLERGRAYLSSHLVDFEERFDMQAWLLHALAAADRGQDSPKPDKHEAKAFANLWKNRDQLSAFTRALTALSAQWLGFKDEARILAENLANGVKLDQNPQGSILLPANATASSAAQSDATILPTAHWGEDGVYWRWSRGNVESTAFVLMALVEITPDSELIEPTMNWLVKNRRGAQWSNTRDTAIVVLALNAWLRKSGELKASGQYTAMLNGKNVGEITIAQETVLTAPRVLNLPINQLKVGENSITLQRKAGSSPLYFSTRFNFFSLEDPIAAAGNELFVRRKYERTYPVKTLLEGYDSRSDPLLNGGHTNSGDRIEAILTLEAKNNLEYLLIEDLKPAGFEAVALQSGAALYAKELRPGALDQVDRYTGRTQWVYQELRDRQIASFIDKLPQGLWEIRYELRAETPGQFSALPAIAEAMYVPEVRGNSAELKIIVEDK